MKTVLYAWESYCSAFAFVSRYWCDVVGYIACKWPQDIGHESHPMSQIVFTPKHEANIAVHAKGTSCRGRPLAYITKPEAVAFVKRREARWVNSRYRAIIFMVDGILSEVGEGVGDGVMGGTSCRMPASLTERAALGSWYHQSIASAWKRKPACLGRNRIGELGVEDAD